MFSEDSLGSGACSLPSHPHSFTNGTAQHFTEQSAVDLLASTGTMGLEPVDLDEVRKIQARMPAADPDAPVGSNKNPIRIIQQGSQFITTQNVSDESLQQIIQVLTNRALVDDSIGPAGCVDKGPASKVCAIFNRFTNKRIVFRVTRAKRRRRPSSDTGEDEQGGGDARNFNDVRSRHSFVAGRRTMPVEEEIDGGGKRQSAGRKKRKRRGSEDDDPDFEPDLPEEEVLPFPIVRKKSLAGRVSKPPKYLVKDYKHLHLEDLGTRDETGHSDEDELDDSDGGYSDYINAGLSDDTSDGAAKPRSYDCTACEKSFSSRAGLARHKSLKHNPNGIKQAGPWSNPYFAAVRRRKKLKEALEKATKEDLIEFAAPRVAKVMSLWDYMLILTEDGDPPLPCVPKLLIEFMSLVARVRAFLADQLEPFSKQSPTPPVPPPPLPGVVTEKAADTPADEEFLSGRPAPASVKRRRQEQQRRLREQQNKRVNPPEDEMVSQPPAKESENAPNFRLSESSPSPHPVIPTPSTTEFGQKDEPPASQSNSQVEQCALLDAVSETSAPMALTPALSSAPCAESDNPLPAPVTITSTGGNVNTTQTPSSSSSLAAHQDLPERDEGGSPPPSFAEGRNEEETDEETQDGSRTTIVKINTTELSCAVALPLGRYKVREPLCTEYLSRRYRSALTTKWLAGLSKSDAEGANTEGGSGGAALSADGHPGRRKRMPVAITDGSCPPAAAAASGEADVITEVAGDEGHLLKPAAEDLNTAFADSPVSSFLWSGTLFSMSGEGLGYPVPEEWITSGAFLSVLSEDGQPSDLAMEAVSGRLFHRPSGQLVTVVSAADSQYATNAVAADFADNASPSAIAATAGDASALGELQSRGQEAKEECEGGGQGDRSFATPSTEAPSEVQQQAALVDLSTLLPGVTVTELSPGVCLVVKPNGMRFNVEHGGEGITLETLQAILSMDD